MPISRKDYENLTFYYNWHEIYNELPFNWKCPFCGHITKVLDKTKAVPISCEGHQCDGKLIFI